MMVILALMMAPRIAVATSLAHFTPRPTWPLWSPAAKVPDADVAVLGGCGNVPDVLGWIQSGIRMARAGSKAAASRTDDDERLEARALAGAGLLLHGHDLQNLVLQGGAVVVWWGWGGGVWVCVCVCVCV